MQRSAVLLLLLLLPVSFLSSVYGQAGSTKIRAIGDSDEVRLKRSELIAVLQLLEAEAAKLDNNIAQAHAKTEIADALWVLDTVQAKRLLREAFELALPEVEERKKLQQRVVGASLDYPMQADIDRGLARKRVLKVAARDGAFAKELAQLGVEQLGTHQGHLGYTELAAQAISNDDTKAAGEYIMQAVDVDPTLINAGLSILAVAARDRAAADDLTLQYINRLRAVRLSLANGSVVRVHMALRQLVFTDNGGFKGFDSRVQSTQIPPASPTVIRAYVGYVIESFSGMEQAEPGSARRLRGLLLSIWVPLNQYAPELIPAFMAVESLSRRPGEDASLPRESLEETAKRKYEERLKKAADSDQPDRLTIEFAISRGDFDKARKMIGKLEAGQLKTQLTERVNAQEAISLARKDDLLQAETLAARLTTASAILQAYPPLVEKCAAKKDRSCFTTSLVHQAIKQLKSADTTPPAPPPGVPASVIPSKREFDPVLMSFSRLAKAVAPVDQTLALEVLNETVQAANRSEIDTTQGRIGFEADTFGLLAKENDERVVQIADTLKDRLQRIVALASIYQRRAQEFAPKNGGEGAPSQAKIKASLSTQPKSTRPNQSNKD